jgi:hypothetical protein
MYYIFKDLFHEVEMAYYGYINNKKVEKSKNVEKDLKKIQDQLP